MLALVAVKRHVRDRVQAEHVDMILAGLRKVVEREHVSSVNMPALGYDARAGAWPDAWPALEERIRAAFGDLPDLSIEVHEPRNPGGWPAGCLSVHQLRAGRLLSGLGVRELANECGVSVGSIANIENRRTDRPRKNTLEAMRVALEGRGVEFGPKGWVRHVDDGLFGDDDEQEAEALAMLGVCKRALDHVERARRVLHRVCKPANESQGARRAGKGRGGRKTRKRADS